MMKNNGLLKWPLNKNKNGSNNGKNWIHSPEALTSGHIAYLVKFLGVTDAEHPKGIDVVKESIKRLKLDQEIRRAEGGGKIPKAEVTVSIDGVAVQEPKGKKILHQFPLHQISYCADDKTEKKFFSFIAKDGEAHHRCFVFSSEKLAEEITLTIGQAFDLAYKRFLDTSGREMELKREIMVLQKRVAELENENSDLREKLHLEPVHLNEVKLSKSDSNDTDLLICPPVPPRDSSSATNQVFAEFAKTANEIEKRVHENRKVDLFDDDLQLDYKPRGSPDGIEAPPRISPPPKARKNENVISSQADVFSTDPFFTAADPFGMNDFASKNCNEAKMNGFGDALNAFSTNNNTSNGSVNYNNISNFFNSSHITNPNMTVQQNNLANTNQKIQPQQIENALEFLDKKIEEMKVGFSRGIMNDDFPLESLDPLKSS